MLRNSLFIVLLICSVSGARLKTYQLELILNALNNGLQYFEDNVDDINLDAVFCTRKVNEQLEAYLRFEPEVFRTFQTQVQNLRDKSRNISDIGGEYIRKYGGEYAENVGGLLGHSKRLLWHPSRNVRQDHMVSPSPCSSYDFSWKFNDYCFGQIIGNKHQKPCKISDSCKKVYTAPKKRGYHLTHQVLFWEQVKMNNCKSDISQDLITYLCSNVMRDAEQIAAAEFPLADQDLFIEQIGLCGMWGFKDFYKNEWLKKILQWQQPSGCLATKNPDLEDWTCKDHLVPDAKVRVKREERVLEDNCLSHKTGVALIALVTNLRFEAERLYHQIKT